MSLADDLLLHALALCSSEPHLENVTYRRSISASYYSLYHKVVGDAAQLLGPNVTEQTNHRMQRWFDHGEIKRTCGRFLPVRLDQPLRGLLGDISPFLRLVARSFIELQEARHKADYDLAYVPTTDDAFEMFKTAVVAASASEGIAGTAERNIFILSLVLWKNWEKDSSRK